jgi:hypothetical protein
MRLVDHGLHGLDGLDARAGAGHRACPEHHSHIGFCCLNGGEASNETDVWFSAARDKSEI